MAKSKTKQRQPVKGTSDPSNFEGFREWLKAQPREWATTIAARAALRIVPLVSTSESIPTFASKVFRATALARFAARYPNRKVRSAAETAGKAAVGADHLSSAVWAAVLATFADNAWSASFAIQQSAAVAGQSLYHSVKTDVDRLLDASILPEALADSPLWPDQPPAQIGGMWRALKSQLGDHWGVWFAWYEDVLHGIPWSEAELAAFTDVQGDYPWKEVLPWDDGPHAVNMVIASRLKILGTPPEPSVSATASQSSPLPSQGPGPHFGLAANHLIDLSGPGELDASGNNIERLRQLLPLVQQYAEALSRQLVGNKYPELEKAVRDYQATVAGKNESQIAWGHVFGLGVFLQNAADAAQREIKDRLLPELEDNSLAALESLLKLHGPLILASGEGRELHAQADAFDMTRAEIAELAAVSKAVAADLKSNNEIATKAAAAEIEQAANAMDQGRHPERGTIYGMATIRNMSLVLIAAATVSPPILLGLVAGIPGAIAGGAITLLGAESLKKSATFMAIAAQLGAKIDSMTGPALEAWVKKRIQASGPFQDFALKNEDALRQIAAKTQQLKWLADYIDLIKAAREKSDRE